MKNVLDRANEIRLTTKHFEYIQQLLDLGAMDWFIFFFISFYFHFYFLFYHSYIFQYIFYSPPFPNRLKYEIKKAKELGDEDRKIKLSIEMKDLTLDQFQHMFGLNSLRNMRSPENYARFFFLLFKYNKDKSNLFTPLHLPQQQQNNNNNNNNSQKLITLDRKKLAAGMLSFSKTPAHTSLIDFAQLVPETEVQAHKIVQALTKGFIFLFFYFFIFFFFLFFFFFDGRLIMIIFF